MEVTQFQWSTCTRYYTFEELLNRSKDCQNTLLILFDISLSGRNWLIHLHYFFFLMKTVYSFFHREIKNRIEQLGESYIDPNSFRPQGTMDQFQLVPVDTVAGLQFLQSIFWQFITLWRNEKLCSWHFTFIKIFHARCSKAFFF